jgi:DNA-directed RNA polymerase specialized sigma24 family protein
VPGSADETGAAGYRPLLFSIAYGMTGSVGDAEDIVQDAFLISGRYLMWRDCRRKNQPQW